MADSGALRQARHKRHAQGDHSLCRHRPKAAPVTPLPAADAADFDPSAELTLLAGRLRDAYGADPANASLARELRLTLQVLVGQPDLDDEIRDFLIGFSEA
jgi:hypothetical protein